MAAHDDLHVAAIRLRERQEHVRYGSDLERAVADVRDDADDFSAVLKPALSDREPLAEGRLTRPVGAGRGVVDQRDLGLPDAIAVGEVASLEDGNMQRLEVTRRRPRDANELALSRLWSWWKPDRGAVAPSGHRHAEAPAGGLYSRDRAKSLQQSLLKHRSRVDVVPHVRQVELPAEHVVGSTPMLVC